MSARLADTAAGVELTDALVLLVRVPGLHLHLTVDDVTACLSALRRLRRTVDALDVLLRARAER